MKRFYLNIMLQRKIWHLEWVHTYCRHGTQNLCNGCYHHNVLGGRWDVHCQPLWGVCEENGRAAPPLTVQPSTSRLRGSSRHISWIRLLPHGTRLHPPSVRHTWRSTWTGGREWVRNRYQKTWQRWRLDFHPKSICLVLLFYQPYN